MERVSVQYRDLPQMWVKPRKVNDRFPSLMSGAGYSWRRANAASKSALLIGRRSARPISMSTMRSGPENPHASARPSTTRWQPSAQVDGSQPRNESGTVLRGCRGTLDAADSSPARQSFFFSTIVRLASIFGAIYSRAGTDVAFVIFELPGERAEALLYCNGSVGAHGGRTIRKQTRATAIRAAHVRHGG
jgi:hypothetical protein